MTTTTMKEKKILVVGGGGFIGIHVLRALVAAGAEVSCLDLHKPAEAPSKVNWIVGNASDEILLATSLVGYDTVVYLASYSLPGSANSDMASEINSHVRTTIKAAEIANAQGVQKFIFSSSGGTVYGQEAAVPLSETSVTMPRNAYGVSKLAIEHYLRVLGELADIQTISLRIANPFGELQRARTSQGFIAAVMRAAFSGEPLEIWGDGYAVRDFVYVSDVASAVAASCAHTGPSTIMNVGSGVGTTLREVVEQVESATQRKIDVRYKKNRNFDVKRNVLNVALAKELIDWTPHHSLKEGIEKTTAWWHIQESLAA